MKDASGNEWITEPIRKDWNVGCDTVFHMGFKKASFIEILTVGNNGHKQEVRRVYTCIPCHLFMLTAGKRITGG